MLLLVNRFLAVYISQYTCVCTLSPKVPIVTDQVGIVTSALAEDNAMIRQRIYNLLSRCRLISPPCLLSLLDGLLATLRQYPVDRDSVWKLV